MAKFLSDLIVQKLLVEKEKRLTARQIAEWIFENEQKWCAQKKERSAAISTDSELIQQLVAEIGSQRPALQKRYPKIKTTAERPQEILLERQVRGGRGCGCS